MNYHERSRELSSNVKMSLSVTLSAPDDRLPSFRLDDRLIVVTGSSEGISYRSASPRKSSER
jgi:hypothetical protein